MMDPAEVDAFLQGSVKAGFEEFSDDRSGQRSNLFGISISGIGRCLKQQVYRLAGTEPSDPELDAGEKRKANLGTMTHDGLLPAIAQATGAHHEMPVVVTAGPDQIPGRLDLFFEEEGILSDLKTEDSQGVDRAVLRGPHFGYRMQNGGYALGLEQAGYRVEWITWLYMDRDTGLIKPMKERWTRAYALEVLERIWSIQKWRETPDIAPREERGPGLSYVCNGCPWLRRCWGDDARPEQRGPQARLAVDDPALEAAMQRYLDFQQAESKAKGEKEFWKEVVTGGGRNECTAGSLRWYRGKPGKDLDREQIAADYEEFGRPVPYKTNQVGRFYVRPARDDG